MSTVTYKPSVVRLQMSRVLVYIVEFLSSDQPGFVASTLTDAHGVVHLFHDKVPVFTDSDVDASTLLPISGWLGCNVIERFTDGDRELARIDTEKPWDIESTNGDYHFVVLADLVVSDSSP